MVCPRFSPERAFRLIERPPDASECVAIIIDFLKTLNRQEVKSACMILVWEVGLELAVACELDRRSSTFVQVQDLLLARPMKRKPGIYLRSSCWGALKVLAERDETEWRLRPICLRFLLGALGDFTELSWPWHVEKALSRIKLLDFDSHRQLRIMPILEVSVSGSHDHSAMLQSQSEVVDLICDPAFVRMVNWTD
jgi:hypothetical protein